jgi:hypothetical protein
MGSCMKIPSKGNRTSAKLLQPRVDPYLFSGTIEHAIGGSPLSRHAGAAGIVGGLLLFAAAVAGYHARNLATPIQAKAESGEADRNQLTRNLIEVEANTEEVLNITDAGGNLKKIITFDSGYYVSPRKNPPASPMHMSERQCIADADEATTYLGSVEKCQRTGTRP